MNSYPKQILRASRLNDLTAWRENIELSIRVASRVKRNETSFISEHGISTFFAYLGESGTMWPKIVEAVLEPPKMNRSCTQVISPWPYQSLSGQVAWQSL